MRKIALVSLFTLIMVSCFCQRGKNGNLTVSTSATVNEYTILTADAAAGNTSIAVANSGLNTKGRFSANLATGDLVMIIQMQGDSIIGTPNLPWNPNTSIPFDSTWGQITKYNNCGNYEFAQVSAVPNATTIQFDCGLTKNYTAAGKVQVIRVPRYNTLTINSGGSIQCDIWDSAKGGIVAIEILGNTVINSGGSINVTGNGFRGARLDSNGSAYGVNNTASSGKLYFYGKAKGEGIAGYEWSYDQFGGRNCKGSAANGGGGGNGHNAGGGGGGNGGIVANWIDGIGNPDISTANNIAAWKLEYSWLPSVTTRSGGGRGGYTFSSNSADPTKTGPTLNGAAHVTAWGGDYRSVQNGWGGRPLDYSTGKIFMGGGGGAGDQDDDDGGVGGNGGGMVYVVSYGTISGAGQILANGANGGNTGGTPTAPNKFAGKDGAGGAGAGGTVILNSTGNVSGVSVQANGGTGGNQVFILGSSFVGVVTEAEGPGGGGGGGYIATSNSGITESAAGGANGTTASNSMTKFPPNGATSGGVGTTNAAITNFQITAKNDTICSGQTASLIATLTGTVPGGTTINWYSTITGGSPIGTGSPYVTVALTKDTVFYVGTCPGTYRQAVKVIISGSSSVSISSPTTICSGSSANLSASGGTAYSWAPAGSLSSSTISNPVASPTVTTTYTVSITTPCGPGKDSVVITVTPAPTVNVSATSPVICSGNSTTINATGGTSYTWSPSTGLSATTGSSVTANPGTTQTYTVVASTASCNVTKTVVLTVNLTPTITPSSATSICSGNSATLSATGATSYTWAPAIAFTTSTVSVSPTTTTTYSVTGTTNNCTSGQQTIVVTVNSKPPVTVAPPSPGICSGGSVNLIAGGASTYTWSPSTGLNSTTGSSVIANPAATLTYTVIGTSAAGCRDTTTITITVGSSLTASITGKDTVCLGGSTTLTASGGSTYQWSSGSTSAVINVSPVLTTTYSVLVISGTCKDSANVTVKVNPPMNLKITGSPSFSICTGGNTILTASGGTTYNWSGGTTATTSTISVSPVSTTTYSLAVSNGSCTTDTLIVVTVNKKPVPTISAAQTVCAGVSVSLSASGGSGYTWSPSAGLSSAIIANPVASPLVTTIYTVTVSNGSCSATDSVKVTVDPAPNAAACCNTTILNGQSIVLTTVSTTAGETYSWTPATGLSCTGCANPTATPTVTTTYYVAITDTEGCSKKDSVIITVQENCGEVFIPKAFSPNGDGQNDVLYVRGDCIKTMDLIVFDRWGNKIFESDKPSAGWDGKYNGQPMDAGTYVYYLTGQDIFGKAFTQKGNVTLVR